MSTASAKAAPLKLSEFLRVVVSELRSIANGFAPDAMKPEYSAAASESYIGRTKRIFIEARALEIQAESLEASPATGRTTLKAIQEKIEDRLQAISMPKGSSTEDTLRWVLSLFDAQERAGAKT